MLYKIVIQVFFIFGTLIVPKLSLADQEPSGGAGLSVKEMMSQSLVDVLNIPVTSASLKPTSQKISPGNAYIITSQEMDDLGVTSVADAVDKMVPGMNISMNPNFNESVGVRGLVTDSNLKTLLMSDGVDIGDHNNSGFPGGMIDTPFMGDIDRLEVMLGPGALQLGSGAINGYINEITATGASKPGFRVKQEYGSGNARTTELSYGKVQSADFNWFVYGGYYRNDGVKPHFNLSQDDMVDHGGSGINYTATPLPLVAPSDTYYDHVKFGQTGDDYRLSSHLQYGGVERGDLLSFDLKSFYSDTSTSTSLVDTPFIFPETGQWPDEINAIMSDVISPTGAWGYYPTYFYRDQTLSISPETHVYINPTNQIDLVPSYQKIVQYEYPSDWLKVQANELGLDASNLKSLSFGYQNRWGLKAIYNNTTFEDNDISLGGEYKHTDYRAGHNWNGEDDNMMDYESTNQTWDQYSVFGEDQITLGKLTLIPGVRYDVLHAGPITINAGDTNTNVGTAPSDTTAHVTPRIAGAYQLTENDTLKASYSEGFRYVDASVRQWFYDYPYPGQPNKILPETSKDYEITYDKYLPALKIKCDVTSYYDIVRHARGWIDAVNNYGNASKDIQGVGQEYMIKYLPSDKIEVFFAYGWSRPLDSFETDLNVANQNNTWSKYPEQMFKVGGDYKIWKFTFGTLMKLTSGTYVHDMVSDPMAEALYNRWTMEGDINVKYAVTKNADIKLTVKDLIMSNFNQYDNYWQGQYPAMGLRPESARIYLSVDYRF